MSTDPFHPQPDEPDGLERLQLMKRQEAFDEVYEQLSGQPRERVEEALTEALSRRDVTLASPALQAAAEDISLGRPAEVIPPE